ncbi:REP element-mobilizing transposase RayT [Natranaerovirga hydrolytica]|uniref:REP element-mobilizing transposase RayT n=1 Tax=Natranaerovirga hydrolytica TaxID=680378 RepID=A0A4R1MHE7_9FIRM|nr:transposase [Natranaerovirga hydrolytica]TCK90554.1 REP element-mobilizing transposase RayT [Natranaerovirga hydrolytica]
MSRTARQESRSGYYHVILRGNNKSWITQKDVYKTKLIELLKQQENEECLIQLLAWCIMDNHVHIVLKSSINDMSLAMKKINTKFAMYYNKKENMIGHVFQDRFKSEPIDTDEYLIEVIRYVHNNPVKAKIVKKPQEYKWSTYNAYIKQKFITHQMQFVLNYFNNNIQRFEAFHLKTSDKEYLEIKEDVEKYRLEKAEVIIEKYLRDNNANTLLELKKDTDKEHFLITELLKKSGLSLRKISSLTGISYAKVQKRYQAIDLQ